MKYMDLTLLSPEENLACDEALLEWCERADEGEVLRFWEPKQYFVVLGYSNRLRDEVHVEACAKQKITIHRRCSGGGTVLQGPGCLNYALILDIRERAELQSISSANQAIMAVQAQAMEAFLQTPVQVRGHTDLVLGSRKFSGNSQRRKRHYLLFHGSFLRDLNFDLVEELLQQPARQPEYRKARSHVDFLQNLHRPAAPLKAALASAWGAKELLEGLPIGALQRLVEDRYAQPEWNLKF